MIAKKAHTVVCEGFTLTVDEERFPWHLSQEGPKFTRLRDDLWRVDLEIIGILRDAPMPVAPASEAFSDSFCATPPTIAGIVFPWLICDEGFTYQHSHKTLPLVTLGFLAEDVVTDTEVDDQRHIDQTIVDNNGSMHYQSARDTALHQKMHELTKDWPNSNYDPETNTTTGKGWWWTEDGDSITCHHPDGTELVVTL